MEYRTKGLLFSKLMPLEIEFCSITKGMWVRRGGGLKKVVGCSEIFLFSFIIICQNPETIFRNPLVVYKYHQQPFCLPDLCLEDLTC